MVECLPKKHKFLDSVSGQKGKREKEDRCRTLQICFIEFPLIRYEGGLYMDYEEKRNKNENWLLSKSTEARSVHWWGRTSCVLLRDRRIRALLWLFAVVIAFSLFFRGGELLKVFLFIFFGGGHYKAQTGLQSSAILLPHLYVQTVLNIFSLNFLLDI